MPLWLVIIPLIGVLVLNLPLNRSLMNRLACPFGLLLCLGQALLTLSPSGGFWNSRSAWLTSLFMFQPRIDHVTLVMLLAIAIAGFAALFVCRYSITEENRRFNYTNLLILTLSGMNGIVLAEDLFSLYVFLEVTAVGSFILIAFEKGSEAIEGAFKYIILSAVATALILASIALLLMAAGSVTFTDIHAAASASPHSRVILMATAMLLAGLFIKGGVVPFHGWVPDAYSTAPAAVSVLLAGIITKAAGIYTLIRIVTSVVVFGNVIQTLLLIGGALSIVVGALAALGQSDFKRMLAYSSISQVGYIVLGLGAGTMLGMAGAVFHLFNHTIFKSLLFVNAAAVEQQSGTRNMNNLGGIADRMPVTGWTSVIAFLSTAGIPPLAGFWSKLIIVVALWKAGYPGYASLAVLASLLTLAYFLSMQRRVFFGKLTDACASLKEANLWIIVPSCVLALITIGVGILIPWLFGTFLLPIRSLL